MAVAADKNLSQSAQDRINDITARAQRGEISWADANKDANAIRASEGANYTATASGQTVYSGSSGSGGSGSSSGGTSSNNPYGYTPKDGTGVYGMPTNNSTVKNYTQNGVTYQTGADMRRNPAYAGQAVASNGYTVFYDENGYAKMAVKGVADYTPTQDPHVKNGSYGSSGAWTDSNMLTAADQKAIEDIRAAMQRGEMTGDEANAAANAIRSRYGYTIDKSGNVTDLGALATVNNRRQQMGLTVNHGSGTDAYLYLMNGDTPSTQGDSAYQYLKDMYEANNAAQLAALKATYEQNIADSEAVDDLISAEAQRQRNQTAAQNELQRMYMNEMGIMQGLNTGTTGQMALAQSAALQGNLASIGTQEQQSLADNALSRDKLTIAYRNAIDQAKAEGDYQLASALYQEYVRQQELAMKQQAAEQEQANWEAQFAYQKQQNSLADAEAKAKLLAGFGDFSGYKALGYSDAEIALMQNAYNAQYGIQAGAGTTGTPIANPVPRYDNGGLSSDQVKVLQNYYGVTADGLWGKNSSSAAGGLTAGQAWAAFQSGPLKSIEQSVGMNRTSTGQASAIQNYLNAGKITEAQAEDMLRKFGIM